MQKDQRILLVEDDGGIVWALNEVLRGEGFEVCAVSGETEAKRYLEGGSLPDVILLDLSLADGNGFSLFCTVREKYGVPTIFLTASGDEESVCRGLELGAEDYIAKPFRARELVSRIRSVLRRSTCTRNIVQLENVTVDTDKGTVTKNGAEIALSALEYRILLVFIGNRGRLLSRSRLLEEIWDVGGDFVNDNTLTVYIKRLREKIEDDPQDPHIIKTVRGLGYRVD
ncbi:two component transcriptional regulator winged helix family [Anaerotruncus sp. CAG:390]|nr:two component transcriptional regulator winged helix family [Anaerotruncus sp. CAG:390]